MASLTRILDKQLQLGMDERVFQNACTNIPAYGERGRPVAQGMSIPGSHV